MERYGKHIHLRPFQLTDAPELLALRKRNQAFLRPFEPHMPDHHFTLEGQREGIEAAIRKWENDVGYTFGIFTVDSHELIGRLSLSNVVRGAWHSCTIGYFLDESRNGQGLTTEAVRLAVEFAFDDAKLHRVQGAVMPRNLGSIRVLEKVGFRHEGLARYYLKINENWEDHNIYSITVEDW
jgi:[ribosomal protein S5]-alanine N-acetyltransferase